MKIKGKIKDVYRPNQGRIKLETHENIVCRYFFSIFVFMCVCIDVYSYTEKSGYKKHAV